MAREKYSRNNFKRLQVYDKLLRPQTNEPREFINFLHLHYFTYSYIDACALNLYVANCMFQWCSMEPVLIKRISFSYRSRSLTINYSQLIYINSFSIFLLLAGTYRELVYSTNNLWKPQRTTATHYYVCVLCVRSSMYYVIFIANFSCLFF